MNESKRKKIELVGAHRALEFYGLNEGIDNHVTTKSKSEYVKDLDVILMIQFGVYWSEVNIDHVLEIDPSTYCIVERDGSQKELTYETDDPSIIAIQPQETAVYFHIPVYAVNPEVNAIVHTHSLNVATLTCMEQYKLQQVHQNSCRFFDKIAYDQDYNGLALSGALEGERLGKMLQGNEVILTSHHGAFFCNNTLALAFDAAYFLERALMVQLKWMKLSKQPDGKYQLKTIPDDIALMTRDQQKRTIPVNAQVHLDAMIKKLYP